MYSLPSTLLLCLLVSQIAATEDIYPETPLTCIVSQAQQIMLAKFLAEDPKGIYLLTKDFTSKLEYTDTLLVDVPTVILLSNRGFEQAAPFDMKDAAELLVFRSEYRTHRFIKSGMLKYFIRYQNHIYTIVSDPFDRGLFFAPISDILSWVELVERTNAIKKQTDALNLLRAIPDRSTRNQALFVWLEEYFDTYNHNCRVYDVCNWCGMPDQVINWIAESGDFEDAWKAANMYGKLDSINFDREACRNPYSYGKYYGGGPTFQTREGMNFLMKKILDDRMPKKNLKQALAFMINAVMGLYTSGYNTYEPTCQVRDPEMRSQLTDQLMPLLYDHEFNRDAFYVIQNLVTVPCSRVPDERPAVQNLSEFMTIYQSLKYKATDFRTQLAYLITQNAPKEQWITLSGNENGMFVTLDGVDYDANSQVLRFLTGYIAGEYPITANPKIRFEKIINGELDTVLLKDNFQYFKPPMQPGSRIEVKVKIGELTPGTWHFSVFGVAGENQEYNWVSESATFIKKDEY